MPTKQQHITKADGTASFATSLSLDSQTKVDWALVCLFYAALHYIEAYLATTGRHERSHQTRDGIVGRDGNLKPIFDEYEELKFYGYNARYECYGFKAADVTGNATAAFIKIKAHIQRLL